MNPAIILPTLNERENLPQLVACIRRIRPRAHIIVVDDNSEDGTGAIAEQLAKEYGQMDVIHRKERKGIGAAIVDGFRLALEKGFDPIITMDADLSHDPIYLRQFLRLSRHYDLVIGSRYISGVRVDGWRFRKLLISKLANMFVSYVMVKPIWDFTSGYRCYSARFLRSLNLDEIPPQGYLFQIHMVHLAYSLRMRVKEIPILYKDTEYSISKISAHDRRITFFKVFKYRAPFLEILRHLTYLKKDYHRFVAEYDELLNPPPLRKVRRLSPRKTISVSVGIMAYNEEANIRTCLNALLSQKMQKAKIKEIIVVSSGSTDNTNAIVQEYQRKYPHIRLITQPRREGKASAINEFLQFAEGDICILESADTVPASDTIERLTLPFLDPSVGMTGAHPIPVNLPKGFLGFCVQKLWSLHHRMALEKPKCGEMVAFRNIITRIPAYTAVDEAAIESIISEAGYRLVYCPDATVYNKGPEHIRDFMRQRIRIATGHKHLQSTKGYQVASFHGWKIMKYVLKEIRFTPREIFYMIGLILLELTARLVGTVNFYLRDKNPYIWDIAKTTKKLELPRVHALDETIV